MMRFFRKSVVVEIQGGLGNRLFQLFAGLYMAKKLSVKLVIDVSKVSKERDPSYSDFDGLNFTNENFHSFKIKSTKSDLCWRFLAYFAKRRKAAKTFALQVLSYYVQNGVGYDDIIVKSNQPMRLNGYFQTWKFVENLGVEKPVVTNPTTWFSSNLSRIKQAKPVVVHVRLGDYVHNRDGIGLLSVRYFEEALDFLSTKLPDAEVWVFSDDIGAAKLHLLSICDRVDRWVTPPPGAQSCESLILMTEGSALVMSNSTFSWWAGYWSEASTMIITPKEWFRNIEQPLDLQPERWNRFSSYWIE
jgi:hypothetical protein